jgi:branched-chain amino acid transport system substrate-binding protein
MITTAALALLAALQAGPPPVYVGLDLEFGHTSSTSAEAVRRGAALAVEEINAAGGVLGRPLELLPLDNRSVPARGIENVRTLAQRQDVAAVLSGKFSPVVLEELDLLHELKLPLLDPWAAADGIIDHGRHPSYTFRLSLKDSWAIRAIMDSAARRGIKRLGLLLPNTGWGRSNASAAGAYKKEGSGPVVVGTRWYNWGDTTLIEHYEALRTAGAEAILFVTNEGPGAVLVKELAALPKDQRLPILAHHGIVGGDLVTMAGPALREVDLTVVQFFTFADASRPRAKALLAKLKDRYGVADLPQALSAAGTAAAYDLVHLLALAIKRAGALDRPAIRKALEEVEGYDGAVKALPRAFGPDRHEALTPSDVFMARFDEHGALRRVAKER